MCKKVMTGGQPSGTNLIEIGGGGIGRPNEMVKSKLLTKSINPYRGMQDAHAG